MSPPDSPTAQHFHRACDRCRRKKTRCDSVDFSCSNCRGAGQVCTFDIPPGKRGPRGKPRRRVAADAQRLREHVDPGRYPMMGTGHERPSESHFFPMTVVEHEHDPTRQGPVPSPHSLSSQMSPSQARQHPSTLERHLILAEHVSRASSSTRTLESILAECTELFFNHVAPLNMSIHEPSFRHMLGRILEGLPATTSSSLTDRSFTLLTAVCAKVCYFTPPELFPLGASLADIFLEASRDCLSTYAEADLETPSAQSITVRFLHSNCLHTCARSTLSWHIFGEAVRLAQRMRLHDETSYEGLDPVEAELRRNAFWQLYVGDKSLAVLRSMPIVMSDYCFDEGITTRYPSNNSNEFSPGFNANTRLWKCAADLLLQIRIVKAETAHKTDATLRPESQQTLGRLYIEFATCLDDLPSHLLPNASMPPAGTGNENDMAHDKFAVQRADLHMTYHCLKMHLTTKLDEIRYFTQAAEHRDITMLKKTEISRDLIRLLQGLPFGSLMMNGEPCAEKIRLVGVNLLAIAQEPSPLAARAQGDFLILLDILSQLNSKASDALRQEMS